MPDEEICYQATSGNKGKWSTTSFFLPYVKEAKKRGLSCGTFNEEEERKKKLAEEKARKKKEAAEKARKKKLAEQERKRKLEQDKIVQKIKDYKRQAVNFYKDVEEFVK